MRSEEGKHQNLSNITARIANTNVSIPAIEDVILRGESELYS